MAEISPGALIFYLPLDIVWAHAKPEEQKVLIDVELHVGAKHVLNMKPASSGSFCYSYKGDVNVVFCAVIASSEFIRVHTRPSGRIYDVAVLKKSKFCRVSEEYKLKIASV
jgi:hypothetical protein